MKVFVSFLSKFISQIILIFIISLFPELIGGKVSDFLTKILGKYYSIIIVTIGVSALTLKELIDLRNKKHTDNLVQKPLHDNTEINVRKNILEKYQQRLNNKLASRYPINLELKYSLAGTTKKSSLYDNKTIKSTKIKEELILLFEEHNGRLLIVGEPGSGKTTLLLQLAIQIIKKEEEQIPIILDASTWHNKFYSIQKWISELLPQMGFSTSLARNYLKENRLLFLFDGLDELNIKSRSTFLNAVGTYGKEQKIRYVISSRILEYSNSEDAPVYCQIMIKPLTIIQIKTALKTLVSPESRGVIDAIKRDRLLSSVTKTPFYLNTIQLLFSSMKSVEEFEFTKKNIEDRKREIIEMFIKEATANSKYPINKIKKWLSFLAKKMNENSLTTFELTSLQYSWSIWSKWHILVSKSLDRIFLGLLLGFLFGLATGFSIGAFNGFIMALIMGFSFAIISAITYFIEQIPLGNKFDTPITISVKERVKRTLVLPIERVIKSWRLSIIIYSLCGGILGVVISFFAGLPGILFGLALGLILGIIMPFVENISIKTDAARFYLTLSSPYQRFTASAFNYHFSILHHFHLRYLLYKRGLIPKKLISFLEECSSNHILESNGGAWRFRHRILQDYFAEYWNENYDKY